MAVEVTRFDLRELVEDSVARLGIERPVHVDVPADLVVATDRAKLAQAVGNPCSTTPPSSHRPEPPSMSAPRSAKRC